MRSVSALLLAGSVLLPIVSTGCARIGRIADRFAPSVGTRNETQYDCAPDDNSIERHRTIGIEPVRGGVEVTLDDVGQREVLTRVANAPGPLFASQRYAWKGDASSGVMTDAEAIQSYRCRGTGPAPTASARDPALRVLR